MIKVATNSQRDHDDATTASTHHTHTPTASAAQTSSSRSASPRNTASLDLNRLGRLLKDGFKQVTMEIRLANNTMFSQLSEHLEGLGIEASKFGHTVVGNSSPLTIPVPLNVLS